MSSAKKGKTKKQQNNKKKSIWDKSGLRHLFKLWRQNVSSEKKYLPYSKICKGLARYGFDLTPKEVKIKIHNMTSKYRREEKNGLSEWIHFKEVGSILKAAGQDPVETTQKLDGGSPLRKKDSLKKSDLAQRPQSSIKNGGRKVRSESTRSLHEDSITTNITLIPQNGNIKQESELANNIKDIECEILSEPSVTPSNVIQEATINHKMDPANLYSLFDKIKTNAELSLAEFKRASDLFEESSRINRERSELMKKYLSNSLDVQIEMLALIRNMNNALT